MTVAGNLIFSFFSSESLTIFAFDLPAAKIITVTSGFLIIVERPMVITNRFREISIPPKSEAEVA